MKFYLITMCMFFMANCTIKPMEIIDFDDANIDKITEWGSHYVTQEYLVINYRNNKESEQIIQDHLCKILRNDYKKMDAYFISYSKYSEKVNSEEYRNRKKFCELAMVNARLISYGFRRGRVEKRKFKDGKEINPLIDFKCDNLDSK